MKNVQKNRLNSRDSRVIILHVHERACRGREMDRKGGKAAEAWYEAIATRSVVYRPEDTVCREQGTLFSMGVRAWNRCTFEKAYTCICIHGGCCLLCCARCSRNARNSLRRTSDPEAFISYDLLLNTKRAPRLVIR